jgi:hypothetical protein
LQGFSDLSDVRSRKIRAYARDHTTAMASFSSTTNELDFDRLDLAQASQPASRGPQLDADDCDEDGNLETQSRYELRDLIDEQKNQLEHLVRSVEELREFLSEEPDEVEFQTAIKENLVTIEVKTDKIKEMKILLCAIDAAYFMEHYGDPDVIAYHARSVVPPTAAATNAAMNVYRGPVLVPVLVTPEPVSVSVPAITVAVETGSEGDGGLFL